MATIDKGQIKTLAKDNKLFWKPKMRKPPMIMKGNQTVKNIIVIFLFNSVA